MTDTPKPPNVFDLELERLYMVDSAAREYMRAEREFYTGTNPKKPVSRFALSAIGDRLRAALALTPGPNPIIELMRLRELDAYRGQDLAHAREEADGYAENERRRDAEIIELRRELEQVKAALRSATEETGG